MKCTILSILAAGLLLTACGSETVESITFPEIVVNEPENAVGVIEGAVSFAGDTPKRRALPAPDAACAHEGPILDESLVVTGGRLRDVLVWIEAGLGDFTFDHVRDEALVDQRGCVFLPHVLAVRAHQPVRFRNSDALTHNVNCAASKEGFVRNVSPREQSFVRQFGKPELGKRVLCDLHANMLMYVHVLDHPYFAVTGEDGAFTIEGLPPGRYTLAARHEKLGTQRQEIEVKADGATAAAFTFSRK